MTDTLNEVELAAYLDRYETLSAAWARDESAWLLPLRRRAIQRFETLGFPTTKVEEWKYCDVSPIRKLAVRYSEPSANFDDLIDVARRSKIKGLVSTQLVFVNGRFHTEWSSVGSLPEGVVVEPMAKAIRTRRELLEGNLGAHADVEYNAFAAMNSALFEDGLLVYVPRGVTLERPLHCIHLSTACDGARSAALDATGLRAANGGKATGEDPTVCHPRNLYLLEEGAQVSVIEDYASLDEEAFLVNPVSEIVMGPGARLGLTKVQRSNVRTFHVSGTYARVERDADLQAVSISRGGRLVRNDLEVILDAPGASCSLTGLNVACGTQLMDDHTSIVHAKPHGTSREYYKSILDERSNGVFNGKVVVAADAQKSSAEQSNKNLILSDQALMNTKPQLEIFADDVKCSHGATIGQLDPNALFYLRSRGIELEEARSMLTHAFAGDIVQGIDNEAVRKMVDDLMTYPLCRRAGFSVGEQRRREEVKT